MRLKRESELVARRSSTGGAAYVEFLLAFLPIFTLFMGLLQIIVLYGARVMTQHAATRAARTASVVIDDDPAYYLGEERGFVGGQRASAEDLARSYRRHLGIDSGSVVTTRRAAVEISAMLALLAITPRDPSGRGNPSGDSIDARARTTREHVDVEVMSSSSVPISLVEDQDVRVRVTFRYPCAIPFAGPLVCGGMTNETIAEATLHNHRADYPYGEGG